MMTLLSRPVEQEPYCWLIKSSQGNLGVHKQHGWCIELEDNIIFFESEERCVPLVPLLDFEEEDFSDFLHNAVLLEPDYSEAIKKFPKLLLLKHVFHSSFSGYWPERALKWVEADEQMQPLLKSELARFVQNKVMPQNARQRAERIVRKLPSG